MKKLLFVLLLSACVPTSVYSNQEIHKMIMDSRKAQERDDHGCLKSKCIWNSGEHGVPHCKCEGDWDYNSL